MLLLIGIVAYIFIGIGAFGLLAFGETNLWERVLALFAPVLWPLYILVAILFIAPYRFIKDGL